MPTFSESSRSKLATCHPELQTLFNEVIRHHDCTIVYGVRTEEEQKRLFAEGKSKTLKSKHLKQPDGWSHAVDVAPYPIDWNDHQRFYYFAGHVMGLAKFLGIKIRYGGDWDGDLNLKDQNFHDLPHFELILP